MKKRKRGKNKNISIMLEYYSRPFAELGNEIQQYGYDVKKPHEIRKRFWSLLPNRVYAPLEINPLLLQYNKSIERELAYIIGKHSLAYWLHIYRRIGPYPAGIDEKPMTIGLVRSALEIAFLKYAQFTPCESIGISKEIPMENILSGMLMAEEFEPERKGLEEGPKQMVLTRFTTLDMLEVYMAEKLAYELWRSTATLRITGKGASISVVSSEPFFLDNRSDELEQLIKVFDNRHRDLLTSLAAVSFGSLKNEDSSGAIIMPTYNVGHISSENLNRLFEDVFSFKIKNSTVFNFMWTPFEIKGYRKSHIPFSEKFFEIHSTDLDSVLLVITALCNRVLLNMKNDPLRAVYKYYQRAYEGPSLKSLIVEEIFRYLSIAAKILDIPQASIIPEKILRAIAFLELTKESQNSIDLQYQGPHKIFLPYGEDRWFIDYAWLHSLLYNLFIGISPDDQKFKGDSLEQLVNFKESILPTKPCKSLLGETKQIDASFEVGNRLVIVECKAFSKSIAFDKGETNAIQFRNEKINKAINEVDEKANWLAANPKGTNYDIQKYDEILPLVITPFVEFMPSLNKSLWLEPELPRVITPTELKLLLEDGQFSKNLYNVVKIIKKT